MGEETDDIMDATGAVVAPEGNGNNSTFNVLLKLVEASGAQGATLNAIASDVKGLRETTTLQLAALQERIGRAESLNDVQNAKIEALAVEIKSQKQELTALKDTITNMRVQYAVIAAAAALVASILTAVASNILANLIQSGLGF